MTKISLSGKKTLRIKDLRNIDEKFKEERKKAETPDNHLQPYRCPMEINHLPPPSAIAPLRAPSAVEDGDAGPNSPYYRRRQKKQQASQNESAEDQTPHLEGSTSIIDIRV